MCGRRGSVTPMGSQQRLEVRAKPFDEPPIPMNRPVDERAACHGLDRASELADVAWCELANQDGLLQEDLVAVERALRSRKGKGVKRRIAQIDLEKRQVIGKRFGRFDVLGHVGGCHEQRTEGGVRGATGDVEAFVDRRGSMLGQR
jgi:hypothetical protein